MFICSIETAHVKQTKACNAHFLLASEQDTVRGVPIQDLRYLSIYRYIRVYGHM